MHSWFEDQGVCTDPEDLVRRVDTQKANIIAISTYNGVALDYLRSVKRQLKGSGLDHIPIYIGGKLNQIVDSGCTQDDLPVDVSGQLRESGAIPCRAMEDMLAHLLLRAS